MSFSYDQCVQITSLYRSYHYDDWSYPNNAFFFLPFKAHILNRSCSFTFHLSLFQAPLSSA